MTKKQFVPEDKNETNEQPKVYLPRASECINDEKTWIKWLTLQYQSYVFDEGKKYKASILDNCPVCSGTGHLSIKVERNLYGYKGLYDEAHACPVCLTGKDKNKRLDIPFYLEKPSCLFQASCPIKREADKQEKCLKCECKFDKKVK